MSYQVLARKWRPGSFKELVGQEHVQRALINALDNNRIHHAFLFTGTRGVGKTTIARIFAKSLNCESGVSSQPCGQCSTCTEISEGRFVDLIEVDAASRTKVEDTRELLENVQYAPTRGRYKVYLIDEVHMLSTHSFNALLKTLEEPPPHVKFLLATTDPQKLPVTILSRCLQFNLKRLPATDIKNYLQSLLQQENIPCDSDGLSQIARAADGSMRDALSLLDQAIAFGGGKVHSDEVQSMLGSIDNHHVMELLQLLHSGNGNELMRKTAEIAQASPNYSSLLADLLTALEHIAIKQLAPEVDVDSIEPQAILGLAQSLSKEDVQLYYQIALNGRRDLPIAPDSKGAFDMIMLRMLAFKPYDNSRQTYNSTTAGHIENTTGKNVNRTESVRQSIRPTPTATPNRVADEPVSSAAPTVNTKSQAHAGSIKPLRENNDTDPVSGKEMRWEQFVSSLALNGLIQ
ncbi:MAG: DNA polymerase III subunit gamma/tau, partial [Gammaproteobacteria bacterium]|nr:DNA polymerase III subunit gamma/tau [Gammaproteobacteria bacterium]